MTHTVTTATIASDQLTLEHESRSHLSTPTLSIRSGTPEGGREHFDGSSDAEHLLDAARRGQPFAWDQLMQRFRPVIRSIAYGYRLDDAEIDDVAQIVWLRLVEHLKRIREPRALSKWVSTTARRECLRLARGRSKLVSIAAFGEDVQPPSDNLGIDGDLLRSEAARIINSGLAELPRVQRDLLLLLSLEPPVSYRAISKILDMPIGSIGPTRARALARLRATKAVRGYLDATPQPRSA